MNSENVKLSFNIFIQKNFESLIRRPIILTTSGSLGIGCTKDNFVCPGAFAVRCKSSCFLFSEGIIQNNFNTLCNLFKCFATNTSNLSTSNTITFNTSNDRSSHSQKFFKIGIPKMYIKYVKTRPVQEIKF